MAYIHTTPDPAKGKGVGEVSRASGSRPTSNFYHYLLKNEKIKIMVKAPKLERAWNPLRSVDETE